MEEKNDARTGEQQAGRNTPPSVPVPTSVFTPDYPPPRPPATGSEAPEESEKINKTDRIMIAATIVIAFGTLVSACAIGFQWYEMHTGGLDTKTIAEASTKNATAAESFAESAKSINEGLSEAVTKLNIQASALKESVAAANRLAADTEQANGNVIAADRPWMGAYTSNPALTIGSKPTFTLQFQNSGKRPARVDLTLYKSGMFSKFPADPEKEYSVSSITFRSRSVIVPGAVSTANFTAEAPMSQMVLDALNSRRIIYFAFAKVEYRDLRTNEKHWTHVCIRYVPEMKTETDNGWKNCEEYNDAN